MGRRSRARGRAAAAVAAPPAPGSGRDQGWRHWARLLNPLRFRELSRTRARVTAAAFGVAAVVTVLVGRVTGEAAWFSSAVLLAVLAVVWGLASAVLGGRDRSG